MSELLMSTKQPIDYQLTQFISRLNLQCRDQAKKIDEQDQLIQSLRSQIISKDQKIQQLEQKLSQQNKQIFQSEQLRVQAEYSNIGHSQFQQYFECRTPISLTNRDEKFQSPMNYFQCDPEDQSLSPISLQMKILNNMDVPSTKLMTISTLDPKIKDGILRESTNGIAKSPRLTQQVNLRAVTPPKYGSDEHLSLSGNSKNDMSWAINSGHKRKTVNQSTTQPPKKYVIETQDINTPLEDQTLHSRNITAHGNQENSQKIYEEFLHLGASSQDIVSAIKKYLSQTPSDSFHDPKVKSSILYRFSASRSIFQSENVLRQEMMKQGLNAQMQVNQFIFPFDVEIRELSNQDGNSEINEILFAKYPIENNPNCFVIPVNSNHDETTPKYQNNKFDLSYQNLLNLYNPNKTIYYVCVRYEDFIDISKYHKSATLANFWAHNRVICIATKFPFIQFYFELLISFLNDVKLNRVCKYQQTDNFSQVDSEYIDKRINEHLVQGLTQLALHPIPYMNSLYSIDFYGQKINLYLKGIQDVDQIELDWALNLMLHYFNSQQMIQIFVTILLERSVVFVGKESHLISCAILMFYKTLLKPMKWVHPLISSLPEVCFDLLDSPVPIIAGILSNCSIFKEKALDLQYPDILFVLFNEKSTELFNKHIIPKISKDVNSYFAKSNLEKILQQIVSSSESLLKKNNRENNLSMNTQFLSIISRSGRTSTPMNQKKINDENTKINGLKIIEIFQQFIKQRIIMNLPKTAIYLNFERTFTQSTHNKQSKRLIDELEKTKPLLDYEKIAQQTLRVLSQQGFNDQEFWRQIFRTQLLIYYLDQFYQK